MTKLIFISALVSTLYASAQDQKSLKYIRFLDIGITSNAHKANTLTVSTSVIDRKIELQRNDFGMPISRPLGFDMDSLYERYIVTDKRTFNKILKFLVDQTQIKNKITDLNVQHLEYPTFEIIINGKKHLYIKHQSVDSFFDSLILYLKTNNCDSAVIDALKISNLG